VNLAVYQQAFNKDSDNSISSFWGKDARKTGSSPEKLPFSIDQCRQKPLNNCEPDGAKVKQKLLFQYPHNTRQKSNS
jgi:hypothetical protein